MKPPFRNYTTEDALSLARDCKYGPLPTNSDPTPTVDEAIEIIKDDPSWKAFNWITGQTAVPVLRATRGEEVEFT